MTITLNNLQSPSSLITFTDIPNILKVEDETGGTYASYTFTFQGNLKAITNADGQWYISFMGETITNVINPDNAINKNFYVSTSNISTAASVARALRNCSSLGANFTIEHNNASVTLRAIEYGIMFEGIQNYLDYNIDATYINVSGNEGSSDSRLVGQKIDVDVYNNGRYITTLEKNFYNGEVAFNISPVITTFADYGRTNPYNLRVSAIVNGEYQLFGNVDTNYVSIGYMVNQGYKYLIGNQTQIAQNYSRGTNKDADNNTILYVYEPSIPISVYAGNSSRMTTKVEYLDSAYNVLTGVTSYANVTSMQLNDLEFNLDTVWLNQAFYIDITIGVNKVRYNVIKPIKATEYGQRILWRNSYGGVSFFDFTGQKTETRDLDVTTYQKNIFDYYTDEMNELEKIYDNEVKYTVTLKSHLIENDGKYIFNDLLQSSKVWTVRNGEKYAIIIDSISVDESDTNNNIFEAKISYHYSQEPSIL